MDGEISFHVPWVADEKTQGQKPQRGFRTAQVQRPRSLIVLSVSSPLGTHMLFNGCKS